MAVYRPKDVLKSRIETALSDINPGVAETVKKIVDEYEGKELEKKLRNLIGIQKTRELLYES
jgi:hypothetical protein